MAKYTHQADLDELVSKLDLERFKGIYRFVAIQRLHDAEKWFGNSDRKYPVKPLALKFELHDFLQLRTYGTYEHLLCAVHEPP